jgi:hypothetical protein
VTSHQTHPGESLSVPRVLLLAGILTLAGGTPNRPALAQSADDPAALAPSNACATLPRAGAKNFEKKLEAFLNAYCYQKQGWVHDPSVRTSDGVHPFVKVYYSPSMWYWMTAGNREGDVPEGAMLIKEQYPAVNQPLNEWTIMVKDPGGSFDGWYWADLSPATTTSSAPTEATTGCPEPAFPFFGFGMYCLNCHASAAKATSTYATTAHVFGKPAFPSFLPRFGAAPPDDSIHHTIPHASASRASAVPKRCMVDESFDHAVAQPKHLPRRHFVTSNQCAGCHDATGTLSPTAKDLPRMLWPDALAPQMADLSPNGEWRYSMMGLSGRDPIFFSQLSSENTLHPRLEGHQTDAREFVQDLCLHCHGVMGQRQYKQDTGKLFTRDQLQNSDSEYGALARDGVSCSVCHHIAPTGLGDPSTFTGNFQLGPANELYGPYNANVATVPMKNALGVEPKATTENQIESSKLCGSCHTVVLPVYDATGKQVVHDGKPAMFTEQATYLEWLNSSFGNRSCQDCHMPRTYKGQPLSYKIANIEDNTFPAVDFRAPDSDITLTTRDTYHRHTLLGINVFALEMFRQFRTELGLYKVNPMLRDPAHTAPGIDTAIEASVDMATRETATVTVNSLTRQGPELTADVQVVNLAGHNFPSGVGFRRAFLNFQVLDGSGKVIWESGGTTADGRIVDGKGSVLPTELFSATQQRFQQHFWQRNPIQRTDQVQIYEELAVNPEGQITTSFLALDRKVKDNRLQPKGWSPAGPFAEETAAVGVCVNPSVCDTDYVNGSGASTVRYQIPLNQIPDAVSVRATLYYQSIPPYYLAQRATQGTGTDTDRLVRFTAKLNVNETPIPSWKLAIASAKQSVQ